MNIYRIDGNKCYHEASKGLSYHLTRELAEQRLTEFGFSLEKRKWENVSEHMPYTADYMWYSIPLSDDGYPFDNTNYAFITEINVNTGE